MATIRSIVTYTIFINKQVKHTNVNNKAGTVYTTYIFYNTVQSKLDSSDAMRAGDVCIE